jgi:hypothetical protein
VDIGAFEIRNMQQVIDQSSSISDLVQSAEGDASDRDIEELSDLFVTPKRWIDSLPLATLLYNISEHKALRMTPWEIHRGFRNTFFLRDPSLSRVDGTSDGDIAHICEASSTGQDQLIGGAVASPREDQLLQLQILDPDLGDDGWESGEDVAETVRLHRKEALFAASFSMLQATREGLQKASRARQEQYDRSYSIANSIHANRHSYRLHVGDLVMFPVQHVKKLKSKLGSRTVVGKLLEVKTNNWGKVTVLGDNGERLSVNIHLRYMKKYVPKNNAEV